MEHVHCAIIGEKLAGGVPSSITAFVRESDILIQGTGHLRPESVIVSTLEACLLTVEQ